MKKTLLKLIVPALAMLAVLAGCSNPAGSGGPPPREAVTYENTDTEGNKYKLEITPRDASRAAQTGDSYVLTVTFRDNTVRISNGTVTVEVSGGSFILNPVNLSGTFSITVNKDTEVITELAITDGTVEYDNNGGSVDEPTMSADKTELEAKIREAIAAKEAAIVAGGAADVPVGVYWVSSSELTIFINAITTAEEAAADPARTDVSVSAAKTALEGAIQDFTEAREEGTMTDPAPEPANKLALIAIIDSAKTEKSGVVTAIDADDANSRLGLGTRWVTAVVMDTFNAAIAAAEAVAADASKTHEDQDDVDDAVSDLEAAIDAFTSPGVIQTVTTVTYTVTFDSTGGSAVPSHVVESGGTVTRPNDPALAGSYLGGWYKDSPSALWDFGAGAVTKNFTLHAAWLNGGTADTADFGGATPTTITVTDKAQWEAALSTISGGGNYAIIVAGDIDGIAGSTTASFGSAATKVSLRGTGSLTLDPGGSKGSLITVGANQGLILRGPVLRGKDNNNVAVVTVEGSGAEFIMENGTVTGNTLNTPREGHDRGGSGVYVGSSAGTAAFTMNGGAISGNTINSGGGHNGGGVYVENDATFTMTGGTISGNTINSGKDGGGVAVGRDGEFTMSGGGSFTMSGGTISGNSTMGNGGGVSVGSGAFTMSGGTISGNSANRDEGHGGGVNIEKEKETDPGSFTMSGGTISGNSALMGGGVGGPKGIFTMSNGTVSGNTASYGGGVLIGGGEPGYDGAWIGDVTFTMEGGTISGNTADYLGGGVLIGGGVDVANGIFTMEGGTISGNTARYGGGVETASAGVFTKTGGTIYGGTAGGNSNRALAAAANHPGHAVCVAYIDGEVATDENTTVEYYRDTTSGPGDNIIVKTGDPGDGTGLLPGPGL